MDYWVVKLCSSIGGQDITSSLWCKGEVEDIFRLVRLHQAHSSTKAVRVILERYASEEEAIAQYMSSVSNTV